MKRRRVQKVIHKETGVEMEVVRVITSKDKMGFALIVNGFYREKDILCGYWDTKENRRKEKVFRPEEVIFKKGIVKVEIRKWIA